jgi:signal transduction histidine kinase
MEAELSLAQKLEAVGQLAAGIAHEINTPIQFVGDTVCFLEDAFRDLMALQPIQDEVNRAAASGGVPAELLERVAAVEDHADLDYLRERVPGAFDRANDGLGRVAAIVGAMREFAHPPTADQAPVDLNEALRNTLIVARSTYEYVADVTTELGDLPPVVCNGGDVNQVFLNLIVNAAHAIEDRVGEGEHVTVSIADTGVGIPADVAGRIFDPFFTTKDVGRGTGQGLAIARTMVVERHGGALTFETEAGHATTFHVRLPIAGLEAAAEPERAAA